MSLIIDREHQAYIDYPEIAEPLLYRAEQVASKGIFLGSSLIPTRRYLNGYNSLLALKYLGLIPTSRVLEIGCGSLRSGFWVINYLNPSMYCGIEPNIKIVNAGGNDILTSDEAAKMPRFLHNDDFDFSGFSVLFDYMLACSIWSHASKPQIEIMLDQFVQNTCPSGKFLTSYIPDSPKGLDYMGSKWVGHSHKSNEKGVVAHKFEWILKQCTSRNLSVGIIPNVFNFDVQVWLCIKKLN